MTTVGDMTWAIVLATFVGPVAAVLITLGYQHYQRQHERRLEIFTALLRSRHLKDDAFRDAVNLTPVQFHNKQKVMASHEALMRVVNSADWQSENVETQRLILDSFDDAISSLIEEMAKSLGMKLPSREVWRGGYLPGTTVQRVGDQAQIQRGLAAILSGREPLRVAPF